MSGDISRRGFLQGGAAVVTAGVAGWGLDPWIGGVLHRRGQYVYPDRPEGWPGVQIRRTVCKQCHSDCGVDARVFNGVLLKLDGNPYHPNSTEPQLTYASDASKAAFTPNLVHSLCPRGQSGRQTVYDPYRITQPLKRTGPRGSKRFQAISWEQLITEVVEGGYLFKDVPGEESRHVDGFRSLWNGGANRLVPVDPNHPDYGPLTNQFVAFWGRAETGQADFIQRFSHALGSINVMPHVGICELNHHVATQQSLNGTGGVAMLKPDILNAEYIIWFGANVNEAGFPMQTLGRKIAKATAEGRLKYVIVDPRAGNASLHADRWVPIQPGGDGALASGMIRWILENQGYDVGFLSNTTMAIANKAGEPNYSNATYLVVADDSSPQRGKFLRASDAGLAATGSADADKFVVVDAVSQQPVIFDRTDTGALWPNGSLNAQPITVNGMKVRTAFQELWAEIAGRSIDEYASLAGVQPSVIVDLAREFTSHGKKAVADFYRGPAMHTNGVYSGRAIMTLNLLIGNIDWQGGYMAGGGGAAVLGKKGYPYDLGSIPGQPKTLPGGVRISRESSFYEKSSAYQEAIKAGNSPYPAPRPWFPFGFGMWQEIFGGIHDGYPYPIKILFQHMANPAWSPPGIGGADDESLPWQRLIKDTGKVPLFIASDIVIAESSAYADYIIPDLTYLEGWGAPSGYPTYPTKATGIRQPVLDPQTGRRVDGEPFSMELFLIDVAKRLGLPGFGVGAFPGGENLDVPEDFYLKMVANVAYDTSFSSMEAGDLVTLGPVPDGTPADVAAIEPLRRKHPQALRDAEWAKVAYVLARGGRFEDYDVGYLRDPNHPWTTHRYGQLGKPVQIYNEVMATTHNAMTGELFRGVAAYEPIRDMKGHLLDELDPKDEFPFLLSTHKQPIHSKSRTIADPWLLEILPENFVEVSTVDGRRLGFQDGDRVRVSSRTYPKGMVGRVRLFPGIRPGVVTVAAAFGHWLYGSGNWAVNGRRYQGDAERNAGVRLNAVMRLDTSLADESGWMVCLTDPVGGGCVYYDTRVRLERA